MDLYYTDLEKYGWTRDSEGKLDIIWDTPENISKAKEIVNQTFSGCKCKTGCDTRKCSCKKNGGYCGPGCQCIGCRNLPTSLPSSSMEQEPLQELEVNERLEEHHSCNSKEAEMTTEESDDEEHYSSLQNEVEEHMRGIFEESSESEASCQSEDSDEEQEAPIP